MTQDTCSLEGCDGQVKTKGLCNMHYLRMTRHGDPGPATRMRSRPGERFPCSIEGCERLARRLGLCGTHYERQRLTGGLAADGPKRGEVSPNWRGKRVSYRAAHTRVVQVKGKASEHDCCMCGSVAEDWAYDHADSDERVDKRGRAYSPDPDHYQPMCRLCHKAFDALPDTLLPHALTDNPQSVV